jgi:N-acetylmuramoyl-L-alanine amidase
VKLADAAARLGFKVARQDRGRKLVLSGHGATAEIEADTRDITVNGVRVFLGEPTEDKGGEIYVSRTDFERRLTPMLRPGTGPGAVPVPRARTIVLDPGHGGRDHGTSRNEKVYALDVALRAKKLLETAGFKVVLTRTEDVYLTLAERPAAAQAHGADLFVSIHFNAIERDTKTSGVEVYTFPPRGQRGTNSWSPGERNNAESDEAPVNRFDYWSTAAAHAIHRRFVGDLKTFDRGNKLMHLGVLRSLKCPGVLVECGFLTSVEEAKKISTPAYREQLARTLTAGIRDYAATLGRAGKK